METATVNHPCCIIYNLSNKPIIGTTPGICRITGKNAAGIPFQKWVRDTFTDLGFLHPGNIISNEAVFCFEEGSEYIAEISGKIYYDYSELLKEEKERVEKWQKKTKTSALPAHQQIGFSLSEKGFYYVPQRFRNYSHFVVNDKWHIKDKGQKADMLTLMLSNPDICVIAESGQRHLLFKHKPGTWQFEDVTIQPDKKRFAFLQTRIHKLSEGFSNDEISSGKYLQHRVIKFGFNSWNELEHDLKPHRGSAMFDLALFFSKIKYNYE